MIRLDWHRSLGVLCHRHHPSDHDRHAISNIKINKQTSPLLFHIHLNQQRKHISLKLNVRLLVLIHTRAHTPCVIWCWCGNKMTTLMWWHYKNKNCSVDEQMNTLSSTTFLCIHRRTQNTYTLAVPFVLLIFYSFFMFRETVIWGTPSTVERQSSGLLSNRSLFFLREVLGGMGGRRRGICCLWQRINVCLSQKLHIQDSIHAHNKH